MSSLGIRRKALLGFALLCAVIGCSLLWRVQHWDDSASTSNQLHRAHDYFIFGYLVLWLGHFLAARVWGIL
jgi:hypothetical protein